MTIPRRLLTVVMLVVMVWLISLWLHVPAGDNWTPLLEWAFLGLIYAGLYHILGPLPKDSRARRLLVLMLGRLPMFALGALAGALLVICYYELRPPPSASAIAVPDYFADLPMRAPTNAWGDPMATPVMRPRKFSR